MGFGGGSKTKPEPNPKPKIVVNQGSGSGMYDASQKSAEVKESIPEQSTLLAPEKHDDDLLKKGIY